MYDKMVKKLKHGKIRILPYFSFLTILSYNIYVCMYVWLYVFVYVLFVFVRRFCSFELYTILYYTILYYTILYCTMLCYTILYYTILYYTILYYTITIQQHCHLTIKVS